MKNRFPAFSRRTHGPVLVALVLLGGALIFLAICRPARESAQRKLFW